MVRKYGKKSNHEGHDKVKDPNLKTCHFLRYFMPFWLVREIGMLTGHNMLYGLLEKQIICWPIGFIFYLIYLNKNPK